MKNILVLLFLIFTGNCFAQNIFEYQAELFYFKEIHGEHRKLPMKDLPSVKIIDSDGNELDLGEFKKNKFKVKLPCGKTNYTIIFYKDNFLDATIKIATDNTKESGKYVYSYNSSILTMVEKDDKMEQNQCKYKLPLEKFVFDGKKSIIKDKEYDSKIKKMTCDQVERELKKISK